MNNTAISPLCLQYKNLYSMDTQTQNTMKPQLKDSVADYMMKPDNRTIIGNVVGVSDQTIRLWILKKDIRLLSYPIMKHVATTLDCTIDELLK
jgi:hypothetical protein